VLEVHLVFLFNGVGVVHYLQHVLPILEPFLLLKPRLIFRLQLFQLLGMYAADHLHLNIKFHTERLWVRKLINVEVALT